MQRRLCALICRCTIRSHDCAISQYQQEPDTQDIQDDVRRYVQTAQALKHQGQGRLRGRWDAFRDFFMSPSWSSKGLPQLSNSCSGARKASSPRCEDARAEAAVDGLSGTEGHTGQPVVPEGGRQESQEHCRILPANAGKCLQCVDWSGSPDLQSMMFIQRVAPYLDQSLGVGGGTCQLQRRRGRKP